jgi:DNA-3-methyladenine glycosylase
MGETGGMSPVPEPRTGPAGHTAAPPRAPERFAQPPPAWHRPVLTRPVLDVAPDLLGARLTTHRPEGTVSVRLTEVEAYDGEDDPGSHAYRGRTPRNAVMFGPAGHLYVYRHLGLHHCANIVTGVEGRASAVLVRAGEVVIGHELARTRREAQGVVRSDVDLARGPARLAVALGLDLTAYGADLLAPDGAIRLEPREGSNVGSGATEPGGSRPRTVLTGPRVGVSGPGGDAARYPWRFWLAGEPTVSAYRPGPARRRPGRPGAAGLAGTAD